MHDRLFCGRDVFYLTPQRKRIHSGPSITCDSVMPDYNIDAERIITLINIRILT